MHTIAVKYPAANTALGVTRGTEVKGRPSREALALLVEPQLNPEQALVQRHAELCQEAFKAKNYSEAMEQCNRILEVAPANAQAWMDKGIAAACLCSQACDRSAEAVQCLRQAASITGDPRLLSQIDLFLIAIRHKWHVNWPYAEVTFDGGKPFEFIVKLWHGKREEVA